MFPITKKKLTPFKGEFFNASKPLLLINRFFFLADYALFG